MLHKIFAIALTLMICFFIESFVSPVFAGAPGESYGWLASKVDYIRDASGCDPDETSIEYQLSYADSKTRLPSFFGTWHVMVRDGDGTIVKVRNFNSTTTSTAVCFNPTTESVQVIVNDSALYHELIGPAISSGEELDSMIGYHFRGYAHLDTKSDANQPYISALYPKSVAIRTNPIFFVETNRETNLYNSPSLEDIKIYAVNLDTNSYNTVTAPASGSLGIREISGMNNLSTDGNYFWVYHQRYNGIAYTEKPNTPYNWTFRSLPTSGATKPLSFVYDTTAPTLNTIGTVKALTAVDSENVDVLVSVSMQDAGSGLSTSTVIVMNTADVVVASLVTKFAVAHRDTITVNLNLSVPENQSLKFAHVISDSAGNTATSTTTSFTVPTAESLTNPVVVSHTATDVRTYQMNLRGQVTSGGGSVVSARGICWELNPGFFTSATNTPRCRNYYSTTGFSNDVFTVYFGGLTASTTIYYRTHATNGSGTTFSTMLSTSTLPTAGATSSVVTVPNLTYGYSASTTADSSRLGGKIDHTGGAPITSRGICWALSAASLPADIETSPNCYRYPLTVPSTAALPIWFDRVFYGLPYNTTIHYRAYTTNSAGTTTKTNTVTTSYPNLDFVGMVAATAATTTYNPDTEDYTIDVRILARDNSNYIIGYNAANLYPIKRSVPYLVELTSPDGSVTYASRTGTMQLQRSSFLSGEPFAPIPTETLTGIPLVGFARLLVTINPDEPDYQESSRTNNYPIDRIINLNNQDELAEEIVNTTGSGFGPVLPDPGYELSFDSDIVRAGTETTLYWDTKVSYPMDCEIIGPTTFAENGIFRFDPSVDSMMTGSVSTGPLESAQIFRITCHEPITNTTYESETRVDVAGALKEV